MDSYEQVEKQLKEQKDDTTDSGIPGARDTERGDAIETFGQERPPKEPGGDNGIDSDVSTTEPTGGEQLPGDGVSAGPEPVAGQQTTGEGEPRGPGDRRVPVVPVTPVSDPRENRSSVGGHNYLLR